MLAWCMDAAKAAGVTAIITVLRPDSGAIQSWLDGAPFVIQQDQRGTGDAVATAREYLEGGGKKGDLKYDLKGGFFRVGEAAEVLEGGAQVGVDVGRVWVEA